MTDKTEANKKDGTDQGGRGSSKDGATSPADSRDERLSAALRANLKRRKAQARSRKSDAPGNGPDNAPDIADETS
ncbi:hypothetical protein QMT40_000573 [Parvibaculaceae bacterium PLY_AMNH_Bact1]|nr:hypothetical protein QMT40_000573 [Parvibaculaceae bacterium PLY_AMNH_Bact1]